MNASSQPKVHKERVANATLVQSRASDPSSHVWVMASAGTGKTTVLVSRFIRLVLMGTPPDKILCLTYTKTAATQMKERVLSRLGTWVCMDEDGLIKELSPLLERTPTAADITKARRLFADFLDQLDRLNIMTIHSFCHSLLARFPFEADMDTGVEMMDDNQSSVMLSGIFKAMLEQSNSDYFERLSQYISDNDWLKYMSLVINNRAYFIDFFEHFNDHEKAIADTVGLPYPLPNDVDYLNDFLSDDNLPLGLLKSWPDRLKTQKDKKIIINKLLSTPHELRYNLYKEYFICFLKSDLSEPPKKIPVDDEAWIVPCEREIERIILARDTLASIKNAQMTFDLCALAKDMLGTYERQKADQSLVDFHDLIHKTLALLTRKDAADWIKYKLDGGLEQVLVDEAQDTGPMQWRIIGQIIAEYFAGEGRDKARARTIFAVGDIKQSIYSFQGADPDSMDMYHKAFRHDANAATQTWDDVPLDTSFRTAQDILDVVDAVSPMSWGDTTHLAGKTQTGRVELFPAIEYIKASKETAVPWTPPIASKNTSNKQILINQLADHIKNLIDGRIAIPSKDNKAVTAGDILILVKSRNHYPAALIQALRKRDIEVAGLDRFKLSDDTSIKDILCLIRWALFDSDDLSLATILKSPFIGWDDAQLGDAAIGRRNRLIDAIKDKDPNVHAWLMDMKYQITRQPIDVALRYIIDAPCPAAPQKSALYAFQSRLGTTCVDALEQWLDFIDVLEPEHKSALAFLSHMDTHDHDIKRELEGENATGVRIMTIHGAKGLEAPIVYLIDTMFTTSSIEKADNLQWIDHPKGAQVPLWATRKDLFSPQLSEAIETAKQKQREEYYRLLYVAMTRAKDGLFILGAHPHHAADDESWYNLIERGLQNLNAHKIGDTLVYGDWNMTASGITDDAMPTHRSEKFEPQRMKIIDDAEETTEETEDLSHISKVLSIGLQWHKLLERAMIEDSNQWDQSIPSWVIDLPDIKPDIAMNKLLSLRNHNEYGHLFDANGAVEVPFITKNNDETTRGRVDRLVETKDAFWIIDYKTTLDPNNSVLLDKYKDQLKNYKIALEKLAQDKPIYTILVDIMNAQIVRLD